MPDIHERGSMPADCSSSSQLAERRGQAGTPLEQVPASKAENRTFWAAFLFATVGDCCLCMQAQQSELDISCLTMNAFTAWSE